MSYVEGCFTCAESEHRPQNPSLSLAARPLSPATPPTPPAGDRTSACSHTTSAPSLQQLQPPPLAPVDVAPPPCLLLPLPSPACYRRRCNSWWCLAGQLSYSPSQKPPPRRHRSPHHAVIEAPASGAWPAS